MLYLNCIEKEDLSKLELAQKIYIQGEIPTSSYIEDVLFWAEKEGLIHLTDKLLGKFKFTKIAQYFAQNMLQKQQSLFCGKVDPEIIKKLEFQNNVVSCKNQLMDSEIPFYLRKIYQENKSKEKLTFSQIQRDFLINSRKVRSCYLEEIFEWAKIHGLVSYPSKSYYKQILFTEKAKKYFDSDDKTEIFNKLTQKLQAEIKIPKKVKIVPQKEEKHSEEQSKNLNSKKSKLQSKLVQNHTRSHLEILIKKLAKQSKIIKTK